MPVPTYSQSLRRYLGMITYLAKFIPRLSEIATPLRQLIKQDSVWHWDNQHQKAFEVINDAISNPPLWSMVLWSEQTTQTLLWCFKIGARRGIASRRYSHCLCVQSFDPNTVILCADWEGTSRRTLCVSKIWWLCVWPSCICQNRSQTTRNYYEKALVFHPSSFTENVASIKAIRYWSSLSPRKGVNHCRHFV